ncbi:MAG: ion transporter [bacterium]
MTAAPTLRNRIFHALDDTDHITTPAENALMTLIVLNVVASILQTVPSLEIIYGRWFADFEVVSIGLFAIEYVLRVWVAPESFIYATPGGRWRYLTSPYALIDLIAILPGLLPALLHVDLRFLRVIRLIRLFRVLKLTRYSDAMHLLGRVLMRTRDELLITVFVLLILLVLSSSFMYLVENSAQPDKFGSIPDAMWWGVATLTTVGYGDIFPITAGGKILAAFMALLGIGMFALPTGIISSAFIEEVTSRKASRTCPHCGESL